ncbi:MAG: putative DNA binding domain-containing protein, partial [Anaerolineae bacterium]|nr:putative DNA binding domain-containing protein [Anaerolineae bacterium]
MTGVGAVVHTQPTADDVRSWLADGQGEAVVFAPASVSSRALAETLVALANAHGGVLLLGVTRRGVPSGLRDPDEARERALAAALMADPPLILPLPAIVDVDGESVCVVTVPPGLPHVYSFRGQFLTRAGVHNRPLTSTELRHLLLDRGETGFEARPVPDATLADLDTELIHRYVREVGGFARDDPYAALLTRGCLIRQEGGHMTPTYAGVLLFGRQPERFVHSAEIIAVRYA